MLGFFKKPVSRMFGGIKTKLQSLFSKPMNTQTLAELRTILIEADIGIKMATSLTDELHIWMKNSSNGTGEGTRKFLEKRLLEILSKLPQPKALSPSVLILLGVNGSGKTTTAAKLAHKFSQEGKSL